MGNNGDRLKEGAPQARTSGYYVFFERLGFATSPTGPLPTIEVAHSVALALLTDRSVVAVRIERRTSSNSKEVATLRRSN
jgi:hypothetical protein